VSRAIQQLTTKDTKFTKLKLFPAFVSFVFFVMESLQPNRGHDVDLLHNDSRRWFAVSPMLLLVTGVSPIFASTSSPLINLPKVVYW